MIHEVFRFGQPQFGFIFIIVVFWASLASAETWLHIDKTSHTLTVYHGETALRSFPVALGADPHFTPEGVFRVIHRIEKPAWKHIPGGDPANPLGDYWLGLNVVAESGERYGIHGTNQPDLIGQDVSDGCIRMRNEDVAFLIDTVPVGTRVVITNATKHGYVVDRGHSSLVWVKIWGEVPDITKIVLFSVREL